MSLLIVGIAGTKTVYSLFGGFSDFIFSMAFLSFMMIWLFFHESRHPNSAFSQILFILILLFEVNTVSQIIHRIYGGLSDIIFIFSFTLIFIVSYCFWKKYQRRKTMIMTSHKNYRTYLSLK